MNLQNKIIHELAVNSDITCSRISLDNANMCATSFSDHFQELFKVMISLDSDSNLYNIEFYYDDNEAYIDISFDNINTASIYCRIRATETYRNEKEDFFKSVPIDEIYSLVYGLLSLKKTPFAK